MEGKWGQALVIAINNSSNASLTPITPSSTLQDSVSGATYPTGKDHTYALGVCNFCHPHKTTTWGVPPHL